MAWLTPGELVVDHSYQRPLSDKQARALAAGFKWAHFQPLTVAKTIDGKYAVIDGQHRLQAALRIPAIVELPCYIVGAHDARQQADAFVAVNTMQRKLWAVDRFKAAIVAGDATAVGIKGVVEKLGIGLMASNGATGPKPMTTRSVQTLMAAYRAQGHQAFSLGLTALAQAWPKESEGFAECYVSALPRIFKLEPQLSVPGAADLLRKVNPTTFRTHCIRLGRDRGKSGSKTVFEELHALMKAARGRAA